MRRSIVRLFTGFVMGCVLAVAMAASASLGVAQTPPAAFGPSAKSEAPPPAFSGPAPQAAPLQAKGPFSDLMSWIAQTQQKMQRQLAASVKNLKSGDAWGAAFWLILGSFLYGIVHAAGPGHGKAIISSYVLANEETVRRGVLISFLAAGVQGLMAVALVGGLVILLKGSGFQVNAWVQHLETASYALVFLVGLYLLVSVLRRMWRRRPEPAPADAGAARVHHDHHHSHDHHHHDHDHGHDHHEHHHHGHEHHHHGHDHENCESCGHIVDVRELTGPMTWRKITAVVLAVGIRPCSGAVLVLIFALAQGLFWAGVASTFAMALGTAITVSVLAALAVGSRQLALSLGGGSARWVENVWAVCAIGGALLVMMIGLLLFLASLGPARPF